MPSTKHAFSRPCSIIYDNGKQITGDLVVQFNDQHIEHWYIDGTPFEFVGPVLLKTEDGSVHYTNGYMHRADGPAVIKSNGHKEWWVNGIPHREDGPAIIHADGSEIWYINGKRHREDGPAVNFTDGYKEWVINGKIHRIDGPAVIYPNNAYYEYYLNGNHITRQVNKWLKRKRYKQTSEPWSQSMVSEFLLTFM